MHFYNARIRQDRPYALRIGTDQRKHRVSDETELEIFIAHIHNINRKNSAEKQNTLQGEIFLFRLLSEEEKGMFMRE